MQRLLAISIIGRTIRIPTAIIKPMMRCRLAADRSGELAFIDRFGWSGWRGDQDIGSPYWGDQRDGHAISKQYTYHTP